jgi:hypothetical protein
VVSASGGGGANANGPLGGGQAGCNLQTGTLVYGLEGDFDAFRSNPQFSNNTNTLSDGVTPFTFTDIAGGANTLHGSTDLVVQIARAGVNFKF